MHVEIQHRDAGQPVMIQRPLRRNRHGAEKAEPHRDRRFRMMARRARGHKSRPCLAAKHRIDCCTGATHGTKPGLP